MDCTYQAVDRVDPCCSILGAPPVVPSSSSAADMGNIHTGKVWADTEEILVFGQANTSAAAVVGGDRPPGLLPAMASVDTSGLEDIHKCCSHSNVNPEEQEESRLAGQADACLATAYLLQRCRLYAPEGSQHGSWK